VREKTSTRRRVAVLAAAAVVLVVGPAAEAKTVAVNWNEAYSFSGSGFLAFHVRKIAVTQSNWQVTMTVANKSPYTVEISRPPLGSVTYIDPKFKGWGGCGGVNLGRQAFGLTKYEYKPAPNGGRGIGGYLTLPWTHATPGFPSKLKPNEKWHGTYSGSGPIPRKTELRLCFGLFTITDAPDANKSDIGTYFSWMTRHTLQL
jgi:hypothetical protein